VAGSLAGLVGWFQDLTQGSTQKLVSSCWEAMMRKRTTNKKQKNRIFLITCTCVAGRRSRVAALAWW
jgi:hypothetical protein